MKGIEFSQGFGWTNMHIYIGSRNYMLQFNDNDPTLLVYSDFEFEQRKRIDGLPKILDFLKKEITEEQFREVEKFCFKNI